jgi:protein SCO1
MQNPFSHTRSLAHALSTLVVAAAITLLCCCGDKKSSQQAQSSGKRSSLPTVKAAPALAGKNLTGRAFQSGELKGSVWVAYFFFTSCAGPCPAMNKRVEDLQTALPQALVKFVGISVDPDTDDAPTLAAYAQRFHADTTRWFMLNMPEDSVKTAAVNGFLFAQGAMNNGPDDPNLHSTRFALVDKQGQIRGYYDGMDDEAIKKLRADCTELLGE